MEEKTIAELVREMEKNDKEGKTQSSKYVSVSMREDIDRTDAYMNSKHISGDTDYLGREKPFFNIVTAQRNIWFRATDIDRKNITFRSNKESDVVKAFLYTIKFQEWMKKEAFGRFLNDWGLKLATHGSAVVKFIESGGELHSSVIDWNNFLCDPIDFKNNLKVEKLWLTASQLKKKKGYDKELVEKLLENPQTRETVEGLKKDNKDDYYLVYEVHGEMPLSLLTDKDEDDDTYVQQMHVITFQEKSDKNSDGFEDYTLYSGRESKDPYMLTHLIEKEGQTYSGGAVKNLFEAQWMVNHSEKMIKDHLELGSKMFFQTSDESFVGANGISSMQDGQVLIHKLNQPLTALNNRPDIGAIQSFKADWQNIGNQINNISESVMGNTAPSGTAWRQVQALLQESHSLFELMTENKGLYLIDMITEHILPFFNKQLDNSDEIAGILEDYQIKKLDSMYLPNEVIRRINKKKKETILSGKVYDPTNDAPLAAQTEQELMAALTGNQRFIKPSEIDGRTWKQVFKDAEFDIDIDVTNEMKDTQGALATLSTVFTTMIANPMALNDPNVKLVFDKILGIVGGVSPIELQTTAQQPVPLPAQAGAAVGGQAPMPQFGQPNQ